MNHVVSLRNQAFVDNQKIFEEKLAVQWAAWKSFEQLQLWYRGEAQELASEQATLATRAATIEAANNVRKRERSQPQSFLGSYGTET
jgi:hypothetical protein